MRYSAAVAFRSVQSMDQLDTTFEKSHRNPREVSFQMSVNGSVSDPIVLLRIRRPLGDHQGKAFARRYGGVVAKTALLGRIE